MKRSQLWMKREKSSWLINVKNKKIKKKYVGQVSELPTGRKTPKEMNEMRTGDLQKKERDSDQL